MHKRSNWTCPKCGYNAKQEAKLEAELAAIRKALKDAGVKLTPTAFTFSAAARRLRVTVPQLRRLVREGRIIASEMGGRPRVTASEIEREKERRAARAR